LSVPVHDLSSGYRLYRRSALQSLAIIGTDFDVLPEILVRLYAEGYRIREVPFQFASHMDGRTRAELARLGWAYAKTLMRMWQLRNSIMSADYDHRAFDSRIPLQRYWQRERHRIILAFTGAGGKILDVGCGSSRILQDLPGSVGVDVLLRKLRFLRPVHPQVAQASVFALPFPDASFDTVICSEVIEHIPDDPRALGELTRVLKPNGTLVLGTPDYGRPLWHIIEWVYGRVAPGGYADEHITHFDRAGLEARLIALGYEGLAYHYVGTCEMIFKARKTARGPRVG
jgi:SAM-dependent methyltransferase